MGETYTYSMREHLSVLESELIGLYEIEQERPMSTYEYRASERTLQILIEACIGIAKQWGYAVSNVAPADAYSAFERLSQLGQDVPDIQWRKIIGMRNALVHDYLNIEPMIIRSVIKQRGFIPLLAFANQGLDVLSKLGK